jgi:hypothetical protein
MGLGKLQMVNTRPQCSFTKWSFYYMYHQCLDLLIVVQLILQNCSSFYLLATAKTNCRVTHAALTKLWPPPPPQRTTSRLTNKYKLYIYTKHVNSKAYSLASLHFSICTQTIYTLTPGTKEDTHQSSVHNAQWAIITRGKYRMIFPHKLMI